MINHKTILKRNTSIITRQENGKYIIFDPATTSMHELNHTGTYIWKFLWKARSAGEIIDNFQKRYNITPEKAEKDVLFFIEKALSNELLSIIP